MRIIKFFVAAVLATGCVPMGGTYGGGSYTVGGYQQQTVGTGVFVNGQELSADDKAKLDWLLDYTVPAGNYYVTNDGMMGVVGQQANVNLIAYAKAKGVYQQGTGNRTAARGSSSHYNGYSGDSITSDGNGCTIMSSGSMTFASGC
jgi:hypothetical protein